MKKTFLISLFLLFTSSVFAVSIPGGGLGTEGSSFDSYYSDGIGLRSMEQVNGEPIPDPVHTVWEGTWDSTGGGGKSAVDVMGDPAQYAEDHYMDWSNPYDPGTWIKGSSPTFPSTYERCYEAVFSDCTAKGGKLLDCQNYAVDVYNISLQHYHYNQNQEPTFIGYFGAPVSTDVALMAMFAGAYLAFALWRKKRSVAKI